MHRLFLTKNLKTIIVKKMLASHIVWLSAERTRRALSRSWQRKVKSRPSNYVMCLSLEVVQMSAEELEGLE